MTEIRYEDSGWYPGDSGAAQFTCTMAPLVSVVVNAVAVTLVGAVGSGGWHTGWGAFQVPSGWHTNGVPSGRPYVKPPMHTTKQVVPPAAQLGLDMPVVSITGQVGKVSTATSFRLSTVPLPPKRISSVDGVLGLESGTMEREP